MLFSRFFCLLYNQYQNLFFYKYLNTYTYTGLTESISYLHINFS